MQMRMELLTSWWMQFLEDEAVNILVIRSPTTRMREVYLLVLRSPKARWKFLIPGDQESNNKDERSFLTF